MFLGGCGAMLGDHLPNAVGGLPEGAPARPTADTAYPAVHSMPPARARPLSDEQQKQLADDLMAARDRASANGDTPPTTGSTPDSKAASGRNQ